MAQSARDRWAKRVREWKASGRSCREFASDAGVNPSTLAWWSWKLGRESEPESRSVLRFVELTGLDDAAAGDRVVETESSRLVLRVDGYAVDVHNGFDGPTLARLLGVLEACR